MESKLLSNVALIAALSKRKIRMGVKTEHEDRAFNDGLDSFVVELANHIRSNA